ncbi:MAG: single-stranded-DNA-specific exonuclease RecJ [candidate division WOR-3 bacterium]
MRWIFRSEDPPQDKKPESIIKFLLKVRGISNFDSFLNPSPKDLNDPFLLDNVGKASEKILEAVRGRKKISIFGDFDADGISATSLMLAFLRKLGAEVDFYIPHRLEEGYGLNKAGIEELKKNGTELLITVDCGINSVLEIERAKELGMEVIVTDHHLPESENPAEIVISPHLSEKYPYKELAGVGIAFKLCQAITKIIGLRENFLFWNLDLVALGTVADVVPLTGENRVITILGLKIMNEGRRPGIVSLFNTAGFKKEKIDAWHIAFILAPRINAIGRLEEAKEAVRLLLTYNKREAELISAKLEKSNIERKKIQEEIYADALKIIESYGEDIPGVVISGKNWHEGVIGIVASKIVEEFYLPTILISEKEGICRGSGRSIPGFNITDCIKGLSHFLEKFGGHSQACGFSIKRENIEDFKNAFVKEVERRMEGKISLKELFIDFPLSLYWVDEKLVRNIEELGPFGIGNPKPVFAAQDIELVCSPNIVGNNHLKFVFKDKDKYFSGIGFSLGDKISSIKDSKKVSIAYTPFVDDWTGKVSLRIYDVKG